jgi:hypothetical protein
METITRRQRKDVTLLGTFVEVYCTGKHPTAERTTHGLAAELGSWQLCSDCAEFLDYAVAKRLHCPLEAKKPICKHCSIHCYDKVHRAKVQKVMAYAGRKMLMRGRLDYLWHYFF